MFLTARDNDIDTVCGLRMGADDYLTKDISLMHLIARVSAIFRRIDALNKPATKQDEIYVDQLSMNTERMSATWQQRNVGLSLTEFWMVYSLAKHAGHVKSRDHLMQESNMVVDDSTITSHIKRIRKKFMAIDPHFNAIDTVYGLGYRWKHDQS
jgi:two-component system OmpR family response regulator